MQSISYRGLAVIVFTAAGIVTSSSADALHVPCDYATIQAAIDAAQQDDAVLVAAGTYAEAINFAGKSITVESADGPELTIIDASGLSTSTVTVNSGEGAGTTLRGFTITGGTGSPNETIATMGELFATSGSERSIDNAGSVVNRIGGGVLVTASSLLVENCIIINNHVPAHAGAGGGFCVILPQDVQIRNCIIEDNSGWLGGGVVVSTGEVIVNDCLFRNNTAEFGGGLDVNVNAIGTVSNTTFHANSATKFGGGATVYNSAIAIFDGCDFTDNTSTHYGGGISTYGIMQAKFCSFDSNASSLGGGIYMGNSAGDTLLENSSLMNNHAVGNGGGIYSTAFGQLTYPSPRLKNVTVCGNTPNNIYGGIEDLGGNVISEHCPTLGDLNNDGSVNVSDLLILLAAWGDCPIKGDCPADLDVNGSVDASDLLILLANWGEVQCEVNARL